VTSATSGQRGAAEAHLRRSDPVLGRLIDAHPDFDPRAWLAELPAMDVFGALVFQIIGQQLSVQATRRLLDRLRDLFGGALPEPAGVLAAGPGELESVGLSRRKVATIRALARRFVAGELSEEVLRGLTDEEIEAKLVEVPGVGPWTVHGFLVIGLDREDVTLPGDLALRKSIQRLYGLDHLPSPVEVLEIAEPWRPYRSLASAYLFDAAYGG
jgi:DNA-3-methyladenine glycosylase II